MAVQKYFQLSHNSHLYTSLYTVFRIIAHNIENSLHENVLSKFKILLVAFQLEVLKFARFILLLKFKLRAHEYFPSVHTLLLVTVLFDIARRTTE
jgi:hypothetical protein